MTRAPIGVIGGSGLYGVEELQPIEEISVTTPFGDPSDAVLIGRWHDVTVAFLPRHGRGHRIMPSHINARANIFAMKTLGVEWLISVSAVGSMREDIAPGEVVIPDQFFDRTVARPSTFFQDGIVAHISFAEPVCAELSGIMHAAAVRAGARVHRGGTYLCIEGPQFSTKAESRIYRQWGVEVIRERRDHRAHSAAERGHGPADHRCGPATYSRRAWKPLSRCFARSDHHQPRCHTDPY